jgi:hypothetical protein
MQHIHRPAAPHDFLLGYVSHRPLYQGHRVANSTFDVAVEPANEHDCFNDFWKTERVAAER